MSKVVEHILIRRAGLKTYITFGRKVRSSMKVQHKLRIYGFMGNFDVLAPRFGMVKTALCLHFSIRITNIVNLHTIPVLSPVPSAVTGRL